MLPWSSGHGKFNLTLEQVVFKNFLRVVNKFKTNG